MKELIFDTREAFDTWHEQVKTEKGYPQVNFNAATGKPMPDKQQTVVFVEPVVPSDKEDKRVMCEFNEKHVPARMLKDRKLRELGFARANGWREQYDDPVAPTKPPKLKPTEKTV